MAFTGRQTPPPCRPDTPAWLAPCRELLTYPQPPGPRLQHAAMPAETWALQVLKAPLFLSCCPFGGPACCLEGLGATWEGVRPPCRPGRGTSTLLVLTAPGRCSPGPSGSALALRPGPDSAQEFPPRSAGLPAPLPLHPEAPAQPHLREGWEALGSPASALSFSAPPTRMGHTIRVSLCSCPCP